MWVAVEHLAIHSSLLSVTILGKTTGSGSQTWPPGADMLASALSMVATFCGFPHKIYILIIINFPFLSTFQMLRCSVTSSYSQLFIYRVSFFFSYAFSTLLYDLSF